MKLDDIRKTLDTLQKASDENKQNFLEAMENSTDDEIPGIKSDSVLGRDMKLDPNRKNNKENLLNNKQIQQLFMRLAQAGEYKKEMGNLEGFSSKTGK